MDEEGSTQQKASIKQSQQEKLQPSNDRKCGKLRELYRDLVAVYKSLWNGPVYYWPPEDHLACQAVFEPHHKGIVIQITWTERREARLFSIKIDEKCLEKYNYFEAIPIQLETQQQEQQPACTT